MCANRTDNFQPLNLCLSMEQLVEKEHSKPEDTTVHLDRQNISIFVILCHFDVHFTSIFTPYSPHKLSKCLSTIVQCRCFSRVNFPFRVPLRESWYWNEHMSVRFVGTNDKWWSVILFACQELNTDEEWHCVCREGNGCEQGYPRGAHREANRYEPAGLNFSRLNFNAGLWRENVTNVVPLNKRSAHLCVILNWRECEYPTAAAQFDVRVLQDHYKPRSPKVPHGKGDTLSTQAVSSSKKACLSWANGLDVFAQKREIRMH